MSRPRSRQWFQTLFLQQVKDCAPRFEIDMVAILSCANLSEGNNLIHEIALKEPKNVPSVPWVEINGKKATQDDENEILENVFKWVCKRVAVSDR